VKRTLLTFVLLSALALNAVVALWLVAPGSKPRLTATTAQQVLSALAPLPQSMGVTDVNGTWQIRSDTPSSVGYRIDEQAAGASFSEAVGRTAAVSSTIVVADHRLRKADITADLSSLASDKLLRDQVLHRQGLEIDKFPTATFATTADMDLSAVTRSQSIIHLDVLGQLTLHGQTRPVTAHVDISFSQGTIALTGTADIKLADFGIIQPKVANILSIADHGLLEWQLFYSVVDSSKPGVTATTSAPTTALSPTGGSAASTVTVVNSAYGKILADGLGRTLYLLGSDPANTSVCTGDCLEAWPAVPAPATSGAGVDASALGQFTRPDGAQQASFNGVPLYRCAYDLKPGDINCQGQGDVWYVVSTAGQAVRTTPKPTTTAP
jgi:predicted lipoprotein with Yx(FWY)xxD motif/polyisoprenoid-binding protein YceI